MPETIDAKARADLAAHEAVCEVLQKQAEQAHKENREEHREILGKLHELGALINKYDKYAIFRWITFGGAILLLVASAVVNHWFQMLR
jgi:hypothetical protein